MTSAGLYIIETTDNEDGTVTVKGELQEPYLTMLKQRQEMFKERIRLNQILMGEL